MEELGPKMGQELSQIYVWSMQDLDMVEPWYTQDPYKQDSYMVKADLGNVLYICMYIMYDS